MAKVLLVFLLLPAVEQRVVDRCDQVDFLIEVLVSAKLFHPLVPLPLGSVLVEENNDDRVVFMQDDSEGLVLLVV